MDKFSNYRMLVKRESPIRILFLPGWRTQISDYESLLSDLHRYGTVLALDLPGFVEEIEVPLTIEDYIQYVEKALEDLNFAPTLIIGYSFGGKLATLLMNKYKFTALLLAPSAFRPSLKRRFIIKLKVLGYKCVKKLRAVGLVRKIPERLQGSEDYKNAADAMRTTLINVKDVYVSAPFVKKVKAQVNIVGYKSDNSIECRVLKSWTRKFENGQFYELNGDHFALFSDHSLVLSIVKRIVS